MKANFKIENDDSDKKETNENIKKTYEENLNLLPKGWNLWSLRSRDDD
jgi:hypothetical protein